MSSRTYLIIPAFNEEKAIANVIHDLPKSLLSEIIVVDNQSTDLTAEKAREAGALVLKEEKKGYGHACLKGIDYLEGLQEPPFCLVFLDGDYSDYPEQLERLLKPIYDDEADLVIGSRALGHRQRASMTPQQIAGNALAALLVRIIYKKKITDLGPFRAIRWDALKQLNMEDKTYGWTVEMQVKAFKKELRYKEVAIDYRPRIGKSKVSGTVKGTILAGYKIILTIFKYAFRSA